VNLKYLPNSHKIFNLCVYFLLFPSLILIRILKAFYFIRFGRIVSTYWGHFIGEGMEAMFNQISKSKKEYVLYHFTKTKTINKQWELILRRNLYIHNFISKKLFRLNQIIPGGKAHEVELDPDPPRFFKSGNTANIIKKDLNSKEEIIGNAWLENLGWQPGQPFVCLQIRDLAQYIASNPSKAPHETLKDFEFTSYRNSNIHTYVTGINWLLEQGVWVIRMGKKASERLPILNPRFIDLPFSSDRCDLLDVWLFKHSSGVISTGSGGDLLALRYNKPILFINFIPLTKMWLMYQSITVPKNLVYGETKKPLTLRNYLESGFHNTGDYSSSGIEILDLNEMEIRLAMIEFWKKIDGSWKVKDSPRQLKFQEEFKRWPEFGRFHDFIHPESRIGHNWLSERDTNFFL
jgi:putative glycosyltransferase (TIGR04372 family)